MILHCKCGATISELDALIDDTQCLDCLHWSNIDRVIDVDADSKDIDFL